jgi:hypothetical protein
MAELRLEVPADAGSDHEAVATVTQLPVPNTEVTRDGGTKQRGGSPRSHYVGFWLTAAAFLVNMGFSAVTTPL